MSSGVTRLAHLPAGFLFPRLPVLIADPIDDKDDASSDALSEAGDAGRGSVGEHHKMTCGQFVLVTFFIVAGGPTGIETVVSSGGPFYACIGLLVIPWLWCLPIALVSAELACALPLNGGPIRYVERCFGRQLASLTGMWTLISNIFATASYAVLVLAYVQAPSLAGTLTPGANVAVMCGIMLLSFASNYTGAQMQGAMSYVIIAMVFLPFVILIFYSCTRFTSDWTQTLPPAALDLNSMIGLVIYNMLGFSLPGNMAGSVQNPKRNFPLAMFIAIVLIIANYFLPVLLVAAAPLPSLQASPRWSEWQLGYFSLAAQQVAGNWLASWVSVSSVLASFCSVEANVAATAHNLQAMSELGFFPAFFSAVSKKYGTPWAASLLVTVLSAVLYTVFAELPGGSGALFSNLVSGAILLTLLNIVLLFASFSRLRFSEPELDRPYRVPFIGRRTSVLVVGIPLAFSAYLFGTAPSLSLITCASAVALSCFFLPACCSRCIGSRKGDALATNSHLTHSLIERVVE